MESLTLLATVSLVFTVIALLYLWRTVYCVRHGRLLRAGTSCVSCAVSGVLATAAIIVSISYYSYDRLVAEQDIGQIEFLAIGRNTYQARLKLPDKTDRLYELRGDEWQLDARMISWQPPMTVLGLDPIFKLERLSGRYSTVDRELSEERTVHDLAPEQPLDLWRLARQFPILLPGVDAYYGSATYLPMADGASYTISLSRDALLARPDNEAGIRAVARWGQDVL